MMVGKLIAIVVVVVAVFVLSAPAWAVPSRSSGTINTHHTRYLPPLYPPIGGRL
jgi:hypothetical protein